ncbi:MAG: peptidoglycan DD-metalloendopeptidase family protein [Croceibacterium sp.]
MTNGFSVLTAALALAAFCATAVEAQRAAPGAPGRTMAETRADLHEALAASRQAAARRAWLERGAAASRDAADKTARQGAVLAASIQQAEAGLAAAEARLSLAQREHAALREQLGREQQPIVHLTGALQQLSRRPLILSVLRPGSVSDVVHLRAMLDSAVPQIQARTGGLRNRLAQSRRLGEAALAATRELRSQQADLTARRQELAALETRQRLAVSQANGSATREAERALALGEQARDLNALVSELDRAGDLRTQLAALPGPILRPARPEQAGLAAIPPETTPPAAASAPPAPYLLPVTGRTIAGFGARSDSAPGAEPSRGLTLAPRAGAMVVAPAAGRVAFAGTYRGYGRIVIVEHPGGWTSLVTGLARTDVAVGDQLVAGAPLGVAAQAVPEITLELRHGGEAVNPLRFVG